MAVAATGVIATLLEWFCNLFSCLSWGRNVGLVLLFGALMLVLEG